MPIRIFACVHQSVFLRGLESVFVGRNDLVFGGGCVDEATLFQRLPEAAAEILIYDVISERNLPYLNIVARNFPSLRLLILLETHCLHLAGQARARGAMACLPKTASCDDLFRSLETLSQEKPRESAALTKREKQILRLVALGKRNKQIAQDLFLSEVTIKTHLNNIYQKLHVHGRVNAASHFLGGAVQ